MYIIRFIVVISSDDWFLVWIGLEINIISFLVLIYRRYRLRVIESCLKYFFVQRLGSALFIRIFYIKYYEIGGIWSIILRYRIGAGPFFYWFPSLCSGIDWISCYILIIFQKILPLLLLSIFIHWLMWLIGFVRLIIGVFGSFNQNRIKGLIAYSRIHHLGWIYIIRMKGDVVWLIYILLYRIVLLRVVLIIVKSEIVDFIKIYIIRKKLWFVIGILRIAGLPPLLGFYLKWIALLYIMDIRKLYILFIVMVSVVILYIYIRVVYDILMGGGLEDSLVEWKVNKYNRFVDIYRVTGIILGIILGIYLLL